MNWRMNSLWMVMVILITPVVVPAQRSTAQETQVTWSARAFVHDTTLPLPSLVDWDKGPKPQTPFKNIQLLQHLTEPQLERVMGYFTESLGVKCEFCHNLDNFSLDENPHKAMARKMIQVVQYLNATEFKEDRVTCFTCHAGQESPVRLPEGFAEPPSLLSQSKPRQLPPEYANVQKLQHLTEPAYEQVMDFFVESLGARNCFFCHDRRDYSKDDLATKVTARRMIGMVQQLNTRFFDSAPVTCYVCHKGNQQPARLGKGWRLERESSEQKP